MRPIKVAIPNNIPISPLIADKICTPIFINRNPIIITKNIAPRMALHLLSLFVLKLILGTFYII